MHAQAVEDLRRIGADLDRDRFPRIHNGGFVQPCEVTGYGIGLEKERRNAGRQGRPSAGSWQRSAAGEGATHGSRASDETSPDLVPDTRSRYLRELRAASEQYPGIEVREQQDGMWLVAKSGLLYGSQRPATFVIGVAFAPAVGIRGWGFWSSPFSQTWIGPRHTNYPDGSICAFEPRDGTWGFGDSLVSLLDLYSLWAARHLYFQAFRRWPGRQAAFNPYERLSEIRDDEYCGCERGDALYSECCKDSDLKKKSEGVDFVRRTGFRKPPKQIVDFLLDRDNPLPLSFVSPGGSRAVALARSLRGSTAGCVLRSATPIPSQ